MITYSAGGRLGNQLFQYVSARLVAEKNNLQLMTEYKWNDTITVTKPKDGEAYRDGPITIVENENTPDILEMKYGKHHYHFQGYWQRAEYYLPNREKILGYFNEKATKDTDKTNIIMHIRLDDYKRFGKGGTVLDPKYYADCLDRENYKTLFIVSDSPDDKYLESFAKYKPTIVSGTEKFNFWFLASFDRIICGNSTFSWWAAFLSNATKIYTPDCWIRNSNDLRHSLQNIQNNIQIKAGFIDY